MSKQKNVKNLIMNVLPDNRPITSLQIVEYHEKCPKNFVPVHRTYDQDADADLWRETTIIFGKRTARYLCISKTEGLPEYVVETLKVCNERELPGEGFSLLTRTADTEQKAWRKRQIVYKLSKRGTVTNAVTDIILCSKIRQAPSGFQLAGEVNGIVICYKIGPVTHRPPPSIPTNDSSIQNIENSFYYVNIANSKSPKESSNGNPSPVTKSVLNNDYEIIRSSYHITSPGQQRPKPPRPPPISNALRANGTLGQHTEVDGVPFVLNSNLTKQTFDDKLFDFSSKPALINNLHYDFQLERQILCTTKTPNSKNPFFSKLSE